MNSPKLENVTVLYAEDNSAELGLLRFYNDLEGWHGYYATSASMLIDIANQALSDGNKIDAVVTDVNFKNDVLTGISGARSIRRVFPDVPIVFVTGYAGSMIREESRRIGAELYSKPVDHETLFARISTLIFWNRTTDLRSYPGVNRRKKSFNLSEHRRRATDKIVEKPLWAVGGTDEGTT